MDHQHGRRPTPVEVSVQVTYRALLARGLEPGEAADLTGYLHGLPRSGSHWTLNEIRGIVRQRLERATALRNGGPAGADGPPPATRVASRARPELNVSVRQRRPTRESRARRNG